ncbi:MAG: nucleoside hydrolase [Bacteroidaceae bacterium]|nr:nucleoside hydrolase [Bacteroidaceae bacterium]
MVLAVVLAGCNAGSTDVPSIILDTDMGNDIDDALALAAMNRYIDLGRVKVLAIGMSKEGAEAAEYTDIVQTWYGHGDIPIGRVSGSTGPRTTGEHYTHKTCALKDETGAPLFARTNGIGQTPSLTEELYRRVLAKQKDHSVTLVTVGFSTNMASLLETQADDISPLSGKELVRKKVKTLVMMAGNMAEEKGEFNVTEDIVAARKVFAEWPTPIVTSPFELGERVRFPHNKVGDIAAGRQPNPVAEAYRFYQGPNYDACSWDPTALIFAVEGENPNFYTLSPAGTIWVDEAGITRFAPLVGGQHRYLLADDNQVEMLTNRLVELVTNR